jgi:hypothetical protein
LSLKTYTKYTLPDQISEAVSITESGKIVTILPYNLNVYIEFTNSIKVSKRRKQSTWLVKAGSHEAKGNVTIPKRNIHFCYIADCGLKGQLFYYCFWLVVIKFQVL